MSWQFISLASAIAVACHSHRISGARALYRRGHVPAFCFYGVGSIASGYIASELEREGLIVVAGFDANGALSRVEVRPVYLAGSGFGMVPPRETARAILDRFEKLSRELADGSYSQAFYREASNGLVRLYLRDLNAAFRQRGLEGIVRKVRRVRLCHVKRLFHRVLAT